MKEAIIVTGLPGSGKTTYIRENFLGFEVLDKDSMRPPELNGCDRAIKRYKPILDLRYMQALQELIDREVPIATETTGKDHNQIRRMLLMLAARGYSTHIIIMDTPPALAFLRAKKREIITGRVMPLSYFAEVMRNRWTPDVML